MKYKAGDKVRVRRDLSRGESIPFGVVGPMAAIAGSIVTISEAIEGSPDKYRLEEDRDGYSWSEKMFEPAPLFSIGGIVPVNGPKLSDIIENAESERKTTSKEYPILKQIDSETIKIIDRFNKEMRYRWSGCKWSEIGTKKSTGIESRKDIRKRLLKL